MKKQQIESILSLSVGDYIARLSLHPSIIKDKPYKIEKKEYMQIFRGEIEVVIIIDEDGRPYKISNTYINKWYRYEQEHTADELYLNSL